tara:strand:- start:2230 stop:2910 length:681 start_codon:yes stop_codon:yes gene_type:complete
MGLLPPNTEIKNFSFFPDSKHEWIKGEDAGNIDSVVKVIDGFVVYKSGRRCNLDILQEFLNPISEGPDPAIAEKKKRNHLTEGLEVEEIDEEKLEKAKAKEESIKKSNKKAELEKQLKELEDKTIEPQIKDSDYKHKEIIKEVSKSPVRLILEANQNSTITPIQVSIPVPIPDTNVINLLRTSFPSHNIEEEIVELAMSMVDGDNVKEIIKSNIESILKNGSQSDI